MTEGTVGPPPPAFPPMPPPTAPAAFPPPMPPPTAPAAFPPPTDASAPRRGLLRRIFRPAVVWSLGAVVVVAGNAWMYHVVDQWRAEDAGLRQQASVAGDSIGESNATLASGEELLALLTSQSDAAATRAAELEAESTALQDQTTAYKDAALGFERCADGRASAITTVLSGGSGSGQSAAADAECASAQQQLDALATGN